MSGKIPPLTPEELARFERARIAVRDLDGSDRFTDRQLLRFLELARGVDPGSVLAVVEIELRRRVGDRRTRSDD